MAKTNRRPIDRFERKQRLAQRVSHEEHNFNQRAAMNAFDEDEEYFYTKWDSNASLVLDS